MRIQVHTKSCYDEDEYGLTHLKRVGGSCEPMVGVSNGTSEQFGVNEMACTWTISEVRRFQ